MISVELKKVADAWYAYRQGRIEEFIAEWQVTNG
jgi:hypothetical protein